MTDMELESQSAINPRHKLRPINPSHLPESISIQGSIACSSWAYYQSKIKEALNGLIQEIWADSNMGHSKLGPKEDEGIINLIQIIEG